MKSTGDEIFDATLACFEPWHQWRKWGDRDELDVFCRLLAKSVVKRPWLNNLHLMVRPAQIRSEQVMRTTLELASRFAPGHERAAPQHVDTPLIVAVYDGRERLLDGSTRINYWLSTGDNSAHLVHVHHIEGPGELVLLPPCRSPGGVG
jgi:hypothetical protein